METLALKHRPRTFNDLVGQRAAQVILRQMVLKNQVPTALLFDGSRGTGKTSTARILAAALNCETPPGPCTHCPSCKAVYTGSSLDVVEIDAASNGLVDDIRQLRQQVMYRVSGAYRVVILDEAHSMSREAFNALLTTLEEPPPGTVFILCTTEPGRILETVVSRCMPFTFRRITVADIIERLTHICTVENLNVEPDLLTLIAERANGGLRDAVMTLDQVTRVGIATVEQFSELFGETDSAPELLASLTAGDIAGAYRVLDHAIARTGDPASITNAIIGLCRDLLILKGGGTIARTGAAQRRRADLAATIATATLLDAMRLLWNLKTQVRAAGDYRANLDLAVGMLGQLFLKTTAAAAPAAPSAPAATRKLSLTEMATISAAEMANRR